MNRKTKILIHTIITSVCLLLVSCAHRMDTEMAAGLIGAHPYVNEYHVGATDRMISGCENDYMGSKNNTDITLHGTNPTAYYYRINDLTIEKIYNLSVNDRTARGEVVLIPGNITKAGEKVNDIRPGKKGERFTVEFVKQDSIGWRISKFYPNNKLFFRNIWRNGEPVYRVIPDYYSM